MPNKIKKNTRKLKKPIGFIRSWWTKKKNKKETAKKLKQGELKFKKYLKSSQKINQKKKFGTNQSESWYNSNKYGTIEPLKETMSVKNVMALLEKKHSTYNSLNNNYPKFTRYSKRYGKTQSLPNFIIASHPALYNSNKNIKTRNHLGQPAYVTTSLTKGKVTQTSRLRPSRY